MQLHKPLLPKGNAHLNSFYEVKKIVATLGYSYKKIDACPNDCILYWEEENKDRTSYPKCGEGR